MNSKAIQHLQRAIDLTTSHKSFGAAKRKREDGNRHHQMTHDSEYHNLLGTLLQRIIDTPYEGEYVVRQKPARLLYAFNRAITDRYEDIPTSQKPPVIDNWAASNYEGDIRVEDYTMKYLNGFFPKDD